MATCDSRIRSGKPLLAEESAPRARRTAFRSASTRARDEAFYGSGQHQNAQMNLNGEDVELAQHNMDIGVPFVVSTRNYGVLWDNNGITRLGNPKPYGFASRDLKIRDAAGKEGGFTARYSIDGQLKLERVEKDINYQYIRDRFNWPKELLTGKEPPTGSPPNILPNQTVTWEGTLESAEGRQAQVPALRQQLFQGVRRRQAGARSLAPELGRLVPQLRRGDGGRQTRRPSRSSGFRNDGYIALLHNDPLPDARASFAHVHLRCRAARSTTTSSRARRRTK